MKLTGWMTYGVTFFSTIFQSYGDDGRMIMKRRVSLRSNDVETTALMLRAASGAISL